MRTPTARHHGCPMSGLGSVFSMCRSVIIAAATAALWGCGADAPDRSSATTVATAAAGGARSGAHASSEPVRDWPMFGRLSSRTSSTGAIGITAGEAPGLRRMTVALPGTVDSAPIFLHGVMAGGATRDLFLMTTTYGRALAVDARSGSIVWTFTPAGYGRWAGSYQIMNATPVASADRRFLFSGSPDGRVHKLAIAGGREQHGRWPVSITRLPEREKLTPSFGLIGGRVVVGTGGYVGDAPPYQGHIVTIAPGSGRILGVTNSLCADRHAIIDPKSCRSSDSAFWSRSGAVEMPDHSLLFATGNAPFDGRRDFGDSVLRVSADGRRLLGSWTPSNHRSLNAGDVDLGSTGPVLIGGGSIMQSGKDALLHVFSTRALRRRGSVGGEIQTLAAPGGMGMFTAPAVWRHAGRTWMFATTGGGTGAYTQSGGRLTRRWSVGRAGTSPIVAGGLLWVYDPSGALLAYRPTTGRLVAQLPAGEGHWNSPVPGHGVIALPEGSANDRSQTGALNLYTTR